jgi:hypothetical protein
LKEEGELGDDDKTDGLNSTSTTLQQNLSKMVAILPFYGSQDSKKVKGWDGGGRGQHHKVRH